MYRLHTLNHAARTVMTDATAHRIMQAHIDCTISLCAAKRQAKRHLVESKRLVPDSSRNGGTTMGH